ncbi:MAG: Ca2+-binding EF-hand superfamily protein, partial [Planctomycetota bacterium]
EAIEDELMLNTSKALPAATSLRDVLDANRDGVLSIEELANATEVLRTLDKNGDGKLTGDELPLAKTRKL